MFNETNNPGALSTPSLRDDPDPAFRKAREQAAYSDLMVGAIGAIGLVVVVTLLFASYNDYIVHKRELPALIARGQRIPAQLSGKPVHVSGRYRYTLEWRVRYSYTVDGRRYVGSAYMHDPPASVAVVYDPLNPAVHRAVGSMERSNVDGRRLIILCAAALVCGFILVVSAPIDALRRLRE